MPTRMRGYDTVGGKPVNEKDKTDLDGTVGRSTSSTHKVDSTNQYCNTYNWCNSRGDSKQIGMATDNPKESGHSEEQDWTGNTKNVNPRGDVFTAVSGVNSIAGKKGEISTYPGPSDSAKYNGVRTCCGNLDNQQEIAKGGGVYDENGGNKVAGVAGMETSWTAMASGRAEYHIGKKTINAEGGVGIGVNKGGSKNVWTRWEPDGTFHIQVKPKGGEGGAATVKILPSGEITITTEASMSIEAAQSVNIKAQQFNVEAEMNLKGNLNETGVHTDNNGVHTHCPC